MGTCVSRPDPRDSSKLFPGVRATQNAEPGIIVLRPPGASQQSRGRAQPAPLPTSSIDKFKPQVETQQVSSFAIDKETGRQAGAAATAEVANAHALAASTASAEAAAAAAAAAISLHLALVDLDKPQRVHAPEPSTIVDPGTVSPVGLKSHNSNDTPLYATLDNSRENEPVEFSDNTYSPSALVA